MQKRYTLLNGTGWVGYLRGDYRTGEYIESWLLNGGLRYQFTADPVLRRGSTTTKAPATYDWTGFYASVDLGAVWGNTQWDFPGAAISPDVAGFLAGGSIGYDYQAGKWLVGVEGASGWTSSSGARPCPSNFFYNCEASFTALSTATGRVGYAFDRFLPYVKAGAVIARGRTSIQCSTGSQPTIIPLACPGQGESKLLAG